MLNATDPPNHQTNSLGETGRNLIGSERPVAPRMALEELVVSALATRDPSTRARPELVFPCSMAGAGSLTCRLPWKNNSSGIKKRAVNKLKLEDRLL